MRGASGWGRAIGLPGLERNGRWGRALEVPGLAALNQAGHARVWSVSCGSQGNCATGGYYTDASNSSPRTAAEPDILPAAAKVT